LKKAYEGASLVREIVLEKCSAVLGRGAFMDMYAWDGGMLC